MIVFTWFSDDQAVSVQDKGVTKRIITTTQRMLAKIDLAINPQKKVWVL